MADRRKNVGRGRSRGRGKKEATPGPAAPPQRDVPVAHQQPEDTLGAVSGVIPQAVASRSTFRGAGTRPAAAPAAAADGMEGIERQMDRLRPAPRRTWMEEDMMPVSCKDKHGSAGTQLNLEGNFVRVKIGAGMLFHYHVDFCPPQESQRLKSGLLYHHKDVLGKATVFDGMALFLLHKLPDDVTVLRTRRLIDDIEVKITITFTVCVERNTNEYLHACNILFSRLMKKMNMTEHNRHHYYMDNPIRIEQHKLEVVPGFQTSILNYENDTLLQLDVSHCIFRTDTVLDMLYLMQQSQSRSDLERRCKTEIVGKTVFTGYNNKNYRVDEIDWNKKVHDTFDYKGRDITILNYYKEKYSITIRDHTQPLLVVRPNKRDVRSGKTDNILLVPELCRITGLTDEIKKDFRVMKDLAIHTRVNPHTRQQRYLDFIRSLKHSLRLLLEEEQETLVAMKSGRKPEIRDELAAWSVELSSQLEKIPGRLLPAETLFMQNRDGSSAPMHYMQEKGDWSREMRGKKMIVSISLVDWVLVFPKFMTRNAEDLLSVLQQIGPPMGMNIANPTSCQIGEDRIDAYLAACRQNVKSSTQMCFCILSNDNKTRYDALKKFLCIERPVPSQMMLKRTFNKDLMSVATKIAIQMNCKMGGVVWTIQIPLSGTMIVGIDTYHDSTQKGRSCAALVSSMNSNFTRYYSHAAYQTAHTELHSNLATSITGAVKAYQSSQNALPEKIIVYRDGVGDGMLDVVKKEEVNVVKAALGRWKDGKIILSYIIVKKRINSRFFKQGHLERGGPRGGGSRGGRGDSGQMGAVNPMAGTVIDRVATKANWFDFFVISQSVSQGTVSPTHFNVIEDTGSNLKPDHFQRLSYKLCHMYYNWQGTVRVPAPCMYAHKLAFLCGQSLHTGFHDALSDKLFYL